MSRFSIKRGRDQQKKRDQDENVFEKGDRKYAPEQY